MSNLYKYLKETMILQDINQKIKHSLDQVRTNINDYCNSNDNEIKELSLDNMINSLNNIINEFDNLGYTYEPDFNPDVNEEVFKQNLLNYKEQINDFISNFSEEKIESFNVQTKYILNLIEIHKSNTKI